MPFGDFFYSLSKHNRYLAALVWGSQGIYSKYEYLERIFFDAILHEDNSTNPTETSNESKYEKIGDHKVKDYVERPHEYKQ